jgi:hypothetical protein
MPRARVTRGSAVILTRTEETKRKAIHGAGLARNKEARVLAAWNDSSLEGPKGRASIPVRLA